jgi:tetratricopeptide (TPR) repeat protein
MKSSDVGSKKYQPMVKKSMRAFVEMCQKLLDKQNYDQCKKETEKAIKLKLYGEIPQDASLFLHCGIANLKLGYLLIAEQMLNNCLAFPEIKSEA